MEEQNKGFTMMLIVLAMAFAIVMFKMATTKSPSTTINNLPKISHVEHVDEMVDCFHNEPEENRLHLVNSPEVDSKLIQDYYESHLDFYVILTQVVNGRELANKVRVYYEDGRVRNDIVSTYFVDE